MAHRIGQGIFIARVVVGTNRIVSIIRHRCAVRRPRCARQEQRNHARALIQNIMWEMRRVIAIATDGIQARANIAGME